MRKVREGELAATRRDIYKRTTVGVYWRKLIFMGGLFALVFFGLTSVQYFKADTISNDLGSSGTGGNSDLSVKIVDMKINLNGTIYIDGKKSKDRVVPVGDVEEIRIPVIDNIDYYLKSVTINVELPKEIAYSVGHEQILMHSVGSPMTYRVVDKSHVVFVATDIAPMATITPVITMPKGTINPPLIVKILNYLQEFKGSVWVAVGVSLPTLSLIFMFFLLSFQMKRQRVVVPANELTAPPLALPPALVGALYHQNVRAREIAATLIDLALRKNIYIMDRERDFAFVKNRFDSRLLSFEKILLSKIFKDNIFSNREEIERRINNHLYSRKISLVSAGIYGLASRLGYFKVDPQKSHLKYWVVGVFGFFVGVAGFVVTLRLLPDPAYLSFFWLGMAASCIVIMIVARRIPIRTELGQQALGDWLAFRNFLSSSEKIPFSFSGQETFQKYLAYSIVLDCEVSWARRFSEHDFEVPQWYMTSESGMGLQEFCLSLYPIVSYVGRSMAAIREPGFK